MGTKLDGIQLKVFLDRYALKLDFVRLARRARPRAASNRGPSPFLRCRRFGPMYENLPALLAPRASKSGAVSWNG